jgi:hypothetical protein
MKQFCVHYEQIFFTADMCFIRFFHLFFFQFVSKLIYLFRFFQWFRYGFKNEPKTLFFGFAKQTKNEQKQTEIRLVLVRTEFFVLFCAHHSFMMLFFRFVLKQIYLF